MEIIKIKDADTQKIVEYMMCQSCDGLGGYDASSDCETYDLWQNCDMCEGRGYMDIERVELDAFMPERDALTSND